MKKATELEANINSLAHFMATHKTELTGMSGIDIFNFWSNDTGADIKYVENAKILAEFASKTAQYGAYDTLM